MSMNLAQVFAANPITIIGNTDILYVVTTGTTDAGISGLSLKALFAPAAGSSSIVTVGTITSGTWHGSVIDSTYGGTGVNNGSSTITIGGNVTLSGAFTFTGTITGNTSVTFPTSGTLATTSQLPTGAALTKTDDTNVTLALGGTPTTALLQATSLTLGWTGILSGTRGGTGINNGASTITIGGNFSMSGAFTFTGTVTGNTAVTFPTSGTLATTAQIPTGAALTKTDDTNVTLTLGGSPTTALVNAASLTLGWTGQLGLTRGGTAASLTASNGGIVYSNATTLAILAGTATAGLALLSGASTTPAWSASPPITRVITQTITATGAYTYTPTAGMVYAIIELQAGGGGSGGTTGAAAQGACGGGGGAGGYLKMIATAAQIGASATGSVGIAGTAGTSGNNAGGNGGNTTIVINSSTWTAAGGVGGGGQASSAAAQLSGTPGAGGNNTTGSNATLIYNIGGGEASYGYSNGVVITLILTSKGGGSFLGQPGGGTAATGTSGKGYGAGATGGVNVTLANATGSAGAIGIVSITEFISI